MTQFKAQLDVKSVRASSTMRFLSDNDRKAWIIILNAHDLCF